MKSKIFVSFKYRILIYFNFFFRPVIHINVQRLELIMKTEKVKHSHWVSLDREFLRFTPVLKPFLFSQEDNSFENELQNIQIVFKRIENDTYE